MFPGGGLEAFDGEGGVFRQLSVEPAGAGKDGTEIMVLVLLQSDAHRFDHSLHEQRRSRQGSEFAVNFLKLPQDMIRERPRAGVDAGAEFSGGLKIPAELLELRQRKIYGELPRAVPDAVPSLVFILKSYYICILIDFHT